MENLTHTLVGVMLSRAVFDRSMKRGALSDEPSPSGGKRFGLMMALAANAPDIDTYPFFYSQLDYLDIHRGPTHAFAFLPLLALLPVGIVWAINRQRPASLLYWWFASMIAVLSHLLLDWTNVYGIRLLLPSSAEWFHLDITNVFDPFIWLILLGSLAAPALSGLVGSEIASRRARKPKRAWAWAALLLLVGYEGIRFTEHEQAIGALDAHLWNGSAAERVHAFPTGLLPTTWRGVVEVELDGQPVVFEVPLDLSMGLSTSDASLTYAANPGADPVAARAITAVRQTPEFQTLERFNQVPFWKVTTSFVDEEEADNAASTLSGQNSPTTLVELIDLRFSTTRGGGGFSARAVVDAAGRVQDTQFGLGAPPIRP